MRTDNSFPLPEFTWLVRDKSWTGGLESSSVQELPLYQVMWLKGKGAHRSIVPQVWLFLSVYTPRQGLCVTE